MINLSIFYENNNKKIDIATINILHIKIHNKLIMTRTNWGLSILLLTLILSMMAVAKFAYIDLEPYQQKANCPIEQCAFLGSDLCIYYRTTYTCYDFLFKYNYTDNDKITYVKTQKIKLTNNFTCGNTSVIRCYFDSRDINETLTLEYRPSVGLLAMIILAMPIIILIVYFIAYHCLESN